MTDARWLSVDPEADPTDIPAEYDRVRPYWANVDEVPDLGALAAVLTAAAGQCEAFAPALPAAPAPLPHGYLLAQGMQARALWRSGTVGGGDQYGAEGYTVTVFPMDWTVKALLRPKAGRPVVA